MPSVNQVFLYWSTRTFRSPTISSSTRSDFRQVVSTGIRTASLSMARSARVIPKSGFTASRRNTDSILRAELNQRRVW